MLNNNIDLFIEKFSKNLPRSLDRIYGLLDRIGNPQNSIQISIQRNALEKSVHIAAWNSCGVCERWVQC